MTDELRPEPNSQQDRPPPPALPASSESGTASSTHAETDSNARTMGMLCHLLALVQFLGIPGVLGPLVIWLLKREEHPFIDSCGKEAVNFQLSVLIYLIVAFVMVFIVIGFFLVPIIMLLSIVYTVIAAIKASDGNDYQYPLTIRFIK
ncbi:MAG: DUF4870 domain-containing protein [Coraliomargarita sp.]